jgi:hypothetical protein
MLLKDVHIRKKFVKTLVNYSEDASQRCAYKKKVREKACKL